MTSLLSYDVVVGFNQCDKMIKLLFLFLTIYGKQNLPNYIKIPESD